MSSFNLLPALQNTRASVKPGDRIVLAVPLGCWSKPDATLREAIEKGYLPEGSTVDVEGSLIVFSAA